MINLYLIVLTYIAPLEEIDKHLDKHREFLSLGYKKGYFIMSGPRIPRAGGIIIASNIPKSALEIFLKDDPFAQHNLAHYEIIEFCANKFNLDNLDNSNSQIK